MKLNLFIRDEKQVEEYSVEDIMNMGVSSEKINTTQKDPVTGREILRSSQLNKTKLGKYELEDIFCINPKSL